MSEPHQIPCPRCGQMFTPRPTRVRTIPFTRNCNTCGLRNLFDGLGSPTPPELLDRYTKYPTLTQEEYSRKVRETWPGEPE